MKRLVDRVAWSLSQECAAAAGARLLLALSGGPDSLLLLDLLVELRERCGLELFCATVDHQLRPASRREALWATAEATRRGVPAELIEVEVDPPTPAAARAARYRALGEAARRVGAEAIVLGHTASDQAETLLDRLVRGSGLRGLGAMAPRTERQGLVLLRPLLGVSRQEVLDEVARRRLEPLVDPTNRDLRFRRSRLRLDVLPRLEQEQPGLVQRWGRLTAQLRDDEQALTEWAARVLAEARTSERGLAGEGDVWSGDDGAPPPEEQPQRIACAPLRAVPTAVAVRALRALFPMEREPGAELLDALLRVCLGRAGSAALDLPGGGRALRVYDTLWLWPAGATVGASAPPAVAVTHPGLYRWGDRNIYVAARLIDSHGPLWLRGPRAGDRAPGRSLKISDLLVNSKVPRSLRPWVPLLVGGAPERVLWIGAPPAPRPPGAAAPLALEPEDAHPPGWPSAGPRQGRVAPQLARTPDESSG